MVTSTVPATAEDRTTDYFQNDISDSWKNTSHFNNMKKRSVEDTNDTETPIHEHNNTPFFSSGGTYHLNLEPKYGSSTFSGEGAGSGYADKWPCGSAPDVETSFFVDHEHDVFNTIAVATSDKKDYTFVAAVDSYGVGDGGNKTDDRQSLDQKLFSNLHQQPHPE